MTTCMTIAPRNSNMTIRFLLHATFLSLRNIPYKSSSCKFHKHQPCHSISSTVNPLASLLPLVAPLYDTFKVYVQFAGLQFNHHTDSTMILLNHTRPSRSFINHLLQKTCLSPCYLYIVVTLPCYSKTHDGGLLQFQTLRGQVFRMAILTSGKS